MACRDVVGGRRAGDVMEALGDAGGVSDTEVNAMDGGGMKFGAAVLDQFAVFMGHRLEVEQEHVAAFLSLVGNVMLQTLRRCVTELNERRVLSRRSVLALESTMRTMKRLKEGIAQEKAQLQAEAARLHKMRERAEAEDEAVRRRVARTKRICISLRAVVERIQRRAALPSAVTGPSGSQMTRLEEPKVDEQRRQDEDDGTAAQLFQVLQAVEEVLLGIH
eukprot:gene12110-8334_t